MSEEAEVIPNAKPLSEEQKAFLEECEVKYASRFTEDDEEYMELFKKDLSAPPIIPFWRDNRGGRRDRRSWDRRDNKRHYERDYSSSHDHGSQSYSGNNHDTGYKRYRSDTNNERDAHSKYYHKDNHRNYRY